MKKTKARCTFRGIILAAALCPIVAIAADAATFPAKPVRLIVPYAPGGTNDVLARVVAPFMSEGLRQPVIIDNRPGAEGNLGIELGARAAPDGYTLVVVNSRLAGARIFNKDVKYDLVRDFAPVGEIGTGESVLVARAKANRLKALGIAGTRPVPELPSVAPIAATLPGFDIGMFYGLSVPAKTPPAVVARLSDELRRTVARPEAQQQLARAFVQPSTVSNDAFAQKVRDEITKWERFSRDTGLAAR